MDNSIQTTASSLKKSRRNRNYQPPSKDIVSFAVIMASNKYPPGSFIIGLVLLQATMLTRLFPRLEVVPVWIRKKVILPPTWSSSLTEYSPAGIAAWHNTMELVEQVYNKYLREAILRENMFAVKLMVPRGKEVSKR